MLFNSFEYKIMLPRLKYICNIVLVALLVMNE